MRGRKGRSRVPFALVRERRGISGAALLQHCCEGRGRREGGGVRRAGRPRRRGAAHLPSASRYPRKEGRTRFLLAFRTTACA